VIGKCAVRPVPITDYGLPIYYAAWIASRWHDPAFPRAFPWFGEPRFWERHIADLFEQLAAMDDPPILSK